MFYFFFCFCFNTFDANNTCISNLLSTGLAFATERTFPIILSMLSLLILVSYREQTGITHISRQYSNSVKEISESLVFLIVLFFKLQGIMCIVLQLLPYSPLRGIWPNISFTKTPDTKSVSSEVGILAMWLSLVTLNTHAFLPWIWK